MKKKSPYTKPFLTDVKTLRDRARKNIGEGGVSFTYKGNVGQGDRNSGEMQRLTCVAFNQRTRANDRYRSSNSCAARSSRSSS